VGKICYTKNVNLRIEELRARRAIEKLSQGEFAKKLGISRSYLAKLELESVPITDKLELRYNELYRDERLIAPITFTRGADCPYCTGVGHRIWRDERNPERDVYECTKCDRVYRARESWQLTDKDWLRITREHEEKH
jgi:transcriptional regulator with XRE-family HTH domain